MKTLTKLLMFLAFPAFALAQNKLDEKWKDSLKTAPNDSFRYELLQKLTDYYSESNREMCVKFLDQAIIIDEKNGKMINLASDLDSKGYEFTHQQKFADALSCLQKAKRLAEDPSNENSFWRSGRVPANNNRRLALLASVHHDLGHLMGVTGNKDQQIKEYRQTIVIAGQAGNQSLVGLANMNIGSIYNDLGKLDSALSMLQKAADIFERSDFKTYIGFVYQEIGSIHEKKGNAMLALSYYHKAETACIAQNNLSALGLTYRHLSDYYLKIKNADSSLFYGKKLLTMMQATGYREKSNGYEILYKCYLLNNKSDSVTKYLKLALASKDSSYNVTIKSLADFQKLSFETQTRLSDLQKEKERIQSRNRTYLMLAAIIFLLVLAITFYLNNRQKQKANILLTGQKEEIRAQRDNLDTALHKLKDTQTQLIQSEKMASLGELTAGIAHEIQNPLNFVNNFSEVNTELIEEMEEEIDKGHLDEVKAIAAGIKENQLKINHHGKRADFIVKGMLQHSRASTGEKQLTDMNVLCDEFLKLSYHGLRAKDKNFNAEFVTHFDKNLPKANVSQQDMGRVMLNLFNNAFYAVNQKQKTVGADFKPTVTVTTFAHPSGGLGVSVRDNGDGIPDAIKDKIMQPFFTTKPTGEGTGLGLSLSYDIVVKGHGGKIDVNSVEEEGSEFIIHLPIV